MALKPPKPGSDTEREYRIGPILRSMGLDASYEPSGIIYIAIRGEQLYWNFNTDEGRAKCWEGYLQDFDCDKVSEHPELMKQKVTQHARSYASVKFPQHKGRGFDPLAVAESIFMHVVKAEEFGFPRTHKTVAYRHAHVLVKELERRKKSATSKGTK